MKVKALAFAGLLSAALGLGPDLGRAACTIGYHPLPLTIEDNRALIDAKIEGHPVRFVVDSGAFFSMISPGVAAELKLSQMALPFGFEVSGLGGDVTPTLTRVKFEIGGTELNHIEFLVGGSEVGHDSAGLLGQNVLHILDVEYDFAHGMMRIVKPKDCGKADMVYWPTTQPHHVVELTHLDTDPRKTTAWAEINGKRVRVEFDTGAQLSYVTLSAARRLGFDPKGPGVVPAGMGSGIGRHAYRTWILPVDSFTLGDEEVRHTRLWVGESGIESVDMLLGADFFLSHHVYVSNSSDKIFFTYNGGPVFDLRTQDLIGKADLQTAATPEAPGAVAAPLEGVEPKTADDYARRGEGYLSRLEFAPAISDLTKAHEMDPSKAAFLLQRGRAYERNRQPFLAMADFDAAAKLEPDNVEVLMARAQLRLSGHDKANALNDLAAAGRKLAPQADSRFELARLYDAAGEFESAAAEFDLWIKAHPDDSRLAVALNGRCWAGGQSGKDLDRALAACDSALRRENRNASFLDSRGLVHLRRGETDKALADYNAALAINPKVAWSLYGRAIAEQRLGMEAQSKADFAAAAAIAPRLADVAKARGIVS